MDNSSKTMFLVAIKFFPYKSLIKTKFQTNKNSSKLTILDELQNPMCH